MPHAKSTTTLAQHHRFKKNTGDGINLYLTGPIGRPRAFYEISPELLAMQW